MHFKSYPLKFRRQYELLCCLLAKIRAFLRKLEPSCKIGAYSEAIIRFCIENDHCWRFLCHSIVRYSRISHLQRGVEPQYWKAFVCFAEEENSHDRKAVVSTSDDIFKHNIASEPSSGANTVVKHCSRGVYSH